MQYIAANNIIWCLDNPFKYSTVWQNIQEEKLEKKICQDGGQLFTLPPLQVGTQGQYEQNTALCQIQQEGPTWTWLLGKQTIDEDIAGLCHHVYVGDQIKMEKMWHKGWKINFTK